MPGGGNRGCMYRSKLVGLTFVARLHSGFITLSQSLAIKTLYVVNFIYRHAY
jgi:hypothetical protein